MAKLRYVYWREDGLWLGYLEEFPDYWTQGRSREELENHLKDLYQDLTSGDIPHIRRVAEIEFACNEKNSYAAWKRWGAFLLDHGVATSSSRKDINHVSATASE